jgi:hypothetical protein
VKFPGPTRQGWVDGSSNRLFTAIGVKFRESRHLLGLQSSVRAGPVLHVDDLPERSAQLVREEPRHEVGGSAGREPDDEPDGTGWIALCAGGAGRRENAKYGTKYGTKYGAKSGGGNRKAPKSRRQWHRSPPQRRTFGKIDPVTSIAPAPTPRRMTVGRTDLPSGWRCLRA